jgi:hypothetical protein
MDRPISRKFRGLFSASHQFIPTDNDLGGNKPIDGRPVKVPPRRMAVILTAMGSPAFHDHTSLDAIWRQATS